MRSTDITFGSILAFGVGWFLPQLASAQTEASGDSSVVMDVLGAGGAVMWVILAISIVGTAVFLERAFDLYVLRRLRAASFLERVLSLIERRQYRQALDHCNVKSRHPLVAAVRAGVLRANQREKDIERAMEKEMLAALPELQKRVSLLSLLANSATLTGLLGTIFGLITAFNSVAQASAAERQEALAGGISQAMYTTAFGISVAVPLLFFHHFLAKRQERIVMQVEEGATSVMVALAGDAPASQPPAERQAAVGMPAMATMMKV